MPKEKKKLLIIIGVSLVLLTIGILVLIYFINLPQSVLSFGDIEIEERQTINWNEIEVDLKAPYFGSLTSGAIGTFGGVITYGSGLIICGDNDGKITISNNYNLDDKLTLTSSGSGTKGCYGNYIKAVMTLPAGTLKVDCDLSATDNRDWGADSYCRIDGLFRENVVSKGKPPNFGVDGGTKTKTISREFTFDNPTILDMSTGGQFGLGNSYSTTITLEFIPLEITEPEEPTDYYRFEFVDNKCTLISILPSEKTSNDYNTIGECEDNIVIRGCGTVASGVEDLCCQNQGFDYWDAKESQCADDEFQYWWIIIGGIILMIVITSIIFIKKRN